MSKTHLELLKFSKQPRSGSDSEALRRKEASSWEPGRAEQRVVLSQDYKLKVSGSPHASPHLPSADTLAELCQKSEVTSLILVCQECFAS